MSGGRYDWVAYDSNAGLFVPAGNPQPSTTYFNEEANAMVDDLLRRIFREAQPEGDYPYSTVPSESRANVVDDLATLKADFVLDLG